MTLSNVPFASLLEPLLSICHRLDTCHVTVFGSATRQPLSEVTDVDLHLVIPQVNSSIFDSLITAAESTAQTLADQAGRPWRVEPRHGPFKPPPEALRELQLHLLLDDTISLTRLPCALLAQRAATGILITGESLFVKRTDCDSPATWFQEARSEMMRWRDALLSREIPFRSWVFDPEPRLAEHRTAARTGWDLRCLLHGAARASDLHYRTVLLMTGRGSGAAGDLARPLLTQIGEEPHWQAVAGCWDRLRDQAAAVIERRLDFLVSGLP